MMAASGIGMQFFTGIPLWLRVAVPLVPGSLVRRPMFATACFMLMLFLGGVGGLLVLSQLYMQRVLGFSAAAATSSPTQPWPGPGPTAHSGQGQVRAAESREAWRRRLPTQGSGALRGPGC